MIFPVTKQTREKISNTIQTKQIIKRLNSHVMGEAKMPASAVSAALGLLRKTIPDLAAVTHSGEVSLKSANELTDDRLAAIATGSGEGTAETSDDPPTLN